MPDDPMHPEVSASLEEVAERAGELIDDLRSAVPSSSAEAPVPPTEDLVKQIEQRLHAFEPAIDSAVASSDTAALQGIESQQQAILEGERQHIAKELTDAQDYLSAAVNEYGETASETDQARAVVTYWQQMTDWLKTYQGEITQYFHELGAGIHTGGSPESGTAPKTVQEELSTFMDYLARTERELGEAAAESLKARMIAERKAQLQ